MNNLIFAVANHVTDHVKTWKQATMIEHVKTKGANASTSQTNAHLADMKVDSAAGPQNDSVAVAVVVVAIMNALLSIIPLGLYKPSIVKRFELTKDSNRKWIKLTDLRDNVQVCVTKYNLSSKTAGFNIIFK